MRKTTITLFFIISLLLLSVLYTRAEEKIEFLVENTPYHITGDFIIKKGQILFIEPGVHINMAKDTSIIVEGSINLSGYPRGGEVIFRAMGRPANYHKGFWRGIIIKSNEDNIINYAVIQHALVSIEMKPGSFAKITNNIITQNKTGLKIEGLKKVSVKRNNFLSNFTDLELINSEGFIESNFFQNSLTNIKLNEAYPKIEGNFFKQAFKNLLESGNNKNLQVGKNWWGCADKEKIKALIIEKGKGKIQFEPFSEKPLDLKEVGVDLKE